jgi:hypothetical protein
LTFFTDSSDATGASISSCDISATTCTADGSSGCSTYVTMSDPASLFSIYVELNTANVISFSMTCSDGSTSYTNTVTINVIDLEAVVDAAAASLTAHSTTTFVPP